MGHATRSSVVIDYLLSLGHEVHIFTSGRVYDFLKEKYPNVYHIKGFNLVYKEDRLMNMTSFIHVTKNLFNRFFPSFHIIAEVCLKVKPNVIISDHEFFTSFIGDYSGIPVIASSNISISDKTDVGLNSLKLAYSKAFTVTSERLSNYNADFFVIPTFFFPKRKKKSVFLTNPVVRAKITKVRPKKGKHVLVYHTSATCTNLLNALAGVDDKFIIYGFGKRPDFKGLKFKDFSEDGFIKDLASSKAVITGGGFSLISEALYLKKPVLSMPLRQHFEQLTNAYYLKRLKFGDSIQDPNSTDILDFLLKLPFYEFYLNKYDFDPMQYPKLIAKLVELNSKTPNETLLRLLKKLTQTKKL